MKFKIKSKIIIKGLIIYWSCFFVAWFFFKKYPEIRGKTIMKESKQFTPIVNNYLKINIKI